MSEESTQVAAQDRSFYVGDWLVEPATSRVSRGDRTVKLEPRVMAVLVYLANRPGVVITREELEAAVWAGTVVGYDALTGTMQKLRRAFQDDPKRPRFIETLSKKGYRLLATVRPLGEAPESDEIDQPNVAIPRVRTRNLVFTPTVLLITGLAATIFVVWLSYWIATDYEHIQVSTNNSIAVLPFDNLGGEPEQEYFANGITDDLITDLSKISSLFVIARDSSYVYKGDPIGVQEVARKLNARYILHGSVRRADEQIRINAQLFDATTGRQVWADRYDGVLENIFELQDEITRKIVAALAIEVNPEDSENLAGLRPQSLEAYDYFLLGRHHFYLYANKEENSKAREFYQKAIEIDPNFALAYAMLGWTHTFDAVNGWTENLEVSLERGQIYAEKAIALNDKIPTAYFVLGFIYRERGEYIKALVEAEKAIELEPSYANGHVLVATLFYYTGRPKEGLERIKKAMRLNPHHPHNYPFHMGQAYFVLGQYNEAIKAFRQGLESYPDSERLHVWLTAAYAQSGDLDQAEWELEQVKMINPEFSLKRIQKAFPFKDPQDLERFLDGLRKVGAAE